MGLHTVCCNSYFRISVFAIAMYYPIRFYTEKAGFFITNGPIRRVYFMEWRNWRNRGIDGMAYAWKKLKTIVEKCCGQQGYSWQFQEFLHAITSVPNLNLNFTFEATLAFVANMFICTWLASNRIGECETLKTRVKLNLNFPQHYAITYTNCM